MNTQQTDVLELRLERIIPAPPARVFAAWTQPALLSQWSAPEGMSVDDGGIELRVGGHWHVHMRHDTNGSIHEAFGVYREIDPPTRLVYTHAWRRADAPGGATPETLLTVEFFPDAGGTRMVLTQAGFDSQGSLEGHTGGWTSCFNRLAALMAAKS